MIHSRSLIAMILLHFLLILMQRIILTSEKCTLLQDTWKRLRKRKWKWKMEMEVEMEIGMENMCASVE